MSESTFVILDNANPLKLCEVEHMSEQAAKELGAKIAALDALALAAWDMMLTWEISGDPRDDGQYAWYVTARDNMTRITLEYPSQ